MTTPTDTAAAEKIAEIQARHDNCLRLWGEYGAVSMARDAHSDRTYLLAQLTTANERLAYSEMIRLEANASWEKDLAAANERADQATAEAAVLLEAARKVIMKLEPYNGSTEDGYFRYCMFCHDGNQESEPETHAKYCVIPAMESAAPLAAAHLALHRRLVEGQRTPGTVEVCIGCQKTQPHWGMVCPGWVGADDEVLGVVMPCPIRAGVKP